jgi:hypothetical protein
LNLSPTKKDFVQIWNELIEVASKITERWDPTSTNESDPGIVLLKVLAGIADKLNYNIDKNILEAYMPTAAQMESMRKLCELVGYDIKYYQSAETTVRINYTGNTADRSDDNDEKLPITGLALPKFTTITNADKDITFVTTNAFPVLFTNDTPWVEVPCIEGQISQCESINDNNIINLAQLDDNNRYYLPEVQIAENGIFVYNVTASTFAAAEAWKQVSNLNTQPSGIHVYKFGYDSLEGRPYLAFPDDIGSLIGDGLVIYFVRTSGLNGNIKARTLEIIEVPTNDDWKDYSAEQFEVVNVDAATNGADIESISTAYNNFKKTIGTFDTLVTCRDYMNKIYSLMDANNSPFVSNVIVTDIRNDINNAITLCSCNEFGILYKETSLTETVWEASSSTVKSIDDGNGNMVNKLFIEQPTKKEIPLLDHFDLVLYPFKTHTQVSSSTDKTKLVSAYDRSFTYTEQMNREIDAALADFKTCAHNLVTPAEGDVVAINNYLRLDALIATSSRVSAIEADAILHNVKVALVNEFNLRNLDFGEEIPFDSILSIIENADTRIKVVSLQEPAVLTTYSVKEREGDSFTSKEYGIASAAGTVDSTKSHKIDYSSEKAKEIYNKLVLRNILAGRASLFDYAETFVSNNSEKPYTIIKDITAALEDPSLLIKDQELSEEEKKELKEKLDAIALEINEVKATISSPGEHVLYKSENGKQEPLRGFYGGAVTLRVFEQENKLSEEVYETYEHSFFKKGTNDIARIEATCEISGSDNTFKNITLGKNEVIKFRAPNLITTKTYPAYVYYRFERGANVSAKSASNETDGSYAEVMSLTSFINKVNHGKKPEQFFTGLWNTPLITDSVKTFTAILGSTSTVISQSPTEVFNTSIAVGTDLALAQDDSSPITLVFTNIEALNKYLEAVKELSAEKTEGVDMSDLEKWLRQYLTSFIDEGLIDTYLENLKGKTEIVFKYYTLVGGTIPAWSAYVRECYSDVYGGAQLPGDTVLWRLSSTSNYPKGRLITEAGQRLYAQSSEYLVNGNVGDTTYICTNLGEDSVFYAVSKDSDVQLRQGDKLYIHYTPSSTNEDGETKEAEPISIVYEGGDANNPIIIKPSGFDLVPSEDVNRQGTSWKKVNVDFVGHGKKNLLALAPNEQLELRSISKVSLSSPARLYKNFDNVELEDGSSDKVITYELKDGEYLFYTDQNTKEAAYYGSGSVITSDKEAYIPRASEPIEISQILEQGLHVVPWSNEVPLSPNRKITITEYQYTTLVEGDTLNTLTLEEGETDRNNKYTISSTREIQTGFNNKNEPVYARKPWVRCLSSKANPITYTASGSKTPTELPRIELSDSFSDSATAWEVCSFLELSTSPGYSQSLRAAAIPQVTAIPQVDTAADEDELYEPPVVSITNKLNVYTKEGTGVSGPIEIVPQATVQPASGGIEVYEPVSFKLSTIAQAASGTFEKPDYSSENDGSEEVVELQMKVFSEEAPQLLKLKELDASITPISVKASQSSSVESVNTIIPTNINNYWSAIDIAEKLASATTPKALKLNFMVPESDTFGIFSIYLETSQDTLKGNSYQNMLKDSSRVFIEIPEEFGNYSEVVSIFNYKNTINNNTYSWWSEGLDAAHPRRCYLRAGLNCIKIAKSCSLLIKAEPEAKGSIIYDNMRLVKGIKTNGVNLSLLDPNAMGAEQLKNATVETKEALANSILSNISALDKNHEFYYNAPIENSLAMEFDKNVSSFSNPYTLYDVNNINNNFVASKLDVKYLDTGLKIAKSSRY